MKFTITAYAGEFGCAPQSFYTVLSGQAPRIDLTELAPYTQFKPAKQVAFTQSVLADNRVDRWQILINTALENSNLIESSKHAPLLMVLPFVDAKFKSQIKKLDFLVSILLINNSFNNNDNPKEAKTIIDKDANTSNLTNAELT